MAKKNRTREKTSFVEVINSLKPKGKTVIRIPLPSTSPQQRFISQITEMRKELSA